MGKASKALNSFIASIPDGKLDGFTGDEHTLHKDTDYRLDNQGMTSGDPRYYNLHVQVNNETTMKKEPGKTVTTALVPVGGSWTPENIRDVLKNNITL